MLISSIENLTCTLRIILPVDCDSLVNTNFELEIITNMDTDPLITISKPAPEDVEVKNATSEEEGYVVIKNIHISNTHSTIRVRYYLEGSTAYKIIADNHIYVRSQ